VEWLGNNGSISNISVNNTDSALIYSGSDLSVIDSNFTRARMYSLYLEGSNHVVYGCKFVDNFGPSIIGYEVLDLNIDDSVFNNTKGTASNIVELCGCINSNISDCIFNNQNNQSITILQGSTVYLANNNLSGSDYIFNYGTILSKTFARLDDVNLNHMVGDVILLNATIYDDNNNC
ncbi:right-handed parallel beta-helix repeat-containing protein, partial [uncultured Methanobrevibacter sp.]|uniref:right-handed parallel beta-helix repeat-containing protein n=1 Tax=uncultured Methanobrevibacter sp. TaxID=253161 RepID=UPI0025F99936